MHSTGSGVDTYMLQNFTDNNRFSFLSFVFRRLFFRLCLRRAFIPSLCVGLAGWLGRRRVRESRAVFEFMASFLWFGGGGHEDGQMSVGDRWSVTADAEYVTTETLLLSSVFVGLFSEYR